MQVKCRWCKTSLSTHDHGYHSCKCGAIAVDSAAGYFRVIGNLEDQEIIND